MVQRRRLDRHRDDVGRGDPVEQLRGRDGGQHVQATPVLLATGLVDEGGLQRAVAQEAQMDVARHLLECGDQLLDPAVRCEGPPW